MRELSFQEVECVTGAYSEATCNIVASGIEYSFALGGGLIGAATGFGIGGYAGGAAGGFLGHLVGMSIMNDCLA